MAEKKKSVKKNKKVVKKDTSSDKIAKAIEKKQNTVKESANKEVKKNVLKNKKIDKSKILLIGVVCVLALLTFFVPVSEMSKVDAAEKMNDWLVATESDEYVVSVIGLTYCQHCQNYHPIIEDISESEGFKLYWFDIDDMDSTTSNILTSTYELEQYSGASPYTFITKNGEFVADVVGGMDEENTKAFLKENGVIE